MLLSCLLNSEKHSIVYVCRLHPPLTSFPLCRDLTWNTLSEEGIPLWTNTVGAPPKLTPQSAPLLHSNSSGGSSGDKIQEMWSCRFHSNRKAIWKLGPAMWSSGMLLLWHATVCRKILNCNSFFCKSKIYLQSIINPVHCSLCTYNPHYV